MNRILLSVTVVILSVLVSIIWIIFYSIGDLGIFVFPRIQSWVFVVLSGFAVVFGFLMGIRYMSTL